MVAFVAASPTLPPKAWLSPIFLRPHLAFEDSTATAFATFLLKMKEPEAVDHEQSAECKRVKELAWKGKRGLQRLRYVTARRREPVFANRLLILHYAHRLRSWTVQAATVVCLLTDHCR